jgi:hypothetical protein
MRSIASGSARRTKTGLAKYNLDKQEVMGLTRKTILKRLEHISLSSWYALKFVDEGVGLREKNYFSAQVQPNYRWQMGQDPHPASLIDDCLLFLCFQLWGVASSKVSLEDVLTFAPVAGREYIKPVCQRHEDIWLDHMLSLMVICSLRKDDFELIRFSKWFRIKNLQTVGTKEQMALQPILYYVADMFRKEKFESYEPLKECQAHFRVKAPPALVAALEGIRSLDAKKTFDNLTTAALDHAKRTNIALTQRPICQQDILAMYASLLWNVAELRGLCPPSVRPEIRPFMLIRQTLGIPSIHTVDG